MLNRNATIGGTTYTPAGKLTHQAVHKPDDDPAGSTLACTTLWSNYPDNHAWFTPIPVPDFREGLHD